MYQPEIERISDELYFVAASPATRRLRTQAELLSQTDVPVLITGETGSGKTTAARLIHSLSLRSSYAFMAVKCAVLTSDLLESELFGYEHTSVAGQAGATAGKVEQCAKGTILLDEVEGMPGAVQRRLLRLLEAGEFVRCGGSTPVRADVRVMATTCGDPKRAAAEKRVQDELFYRLSVFELRVPPLRERQEEIPLLLGHVMNRLTRRYGVPAPHFSGALLEGCQQYPWPGNVRELENFGKRFLTHGDNGAALRELQAHPEFGKVCRNNGQPNGDGGTPGATAVIPMFGGERGWVAPVVLSGGVVPTAGVASHASSSHTSSLKHLVRNAKGEAERGAIAQALERTQWNRKAAARMLHVSYRALLYKIQEYRLVAPAGSPRLYDADDLRQAK